MILYCHRNSDATCVRTSEGFVVKKGSRISSQLTRGCPEHVARKRQHYAKLIDENFFLLDDILFNTPSGAASFVCGGSANGNIEWKNKEGRTLKQINEESY